MKTIQLCFLVIISCLSLQMNAQQAQEILGIANEQKDLDFYEEQSKLWKEEVSRDSKNVKAWVNLYRAKRAFYQKKDYQSWVNDRGEVFTKLQPILAELNKALPNCFEYYWLSSMNTENEELSYEYASKAYAISPERKETYEELLVYYMTRWEAEKAAEIAKKMLNANVYPNALYQWNLNSLQVANSNAIVFTHGDLDTMPRWVLQEGKAIRKDVLVVNSWLMAYSDAYRKGAFKKLKISPFKKSVSDFKNKKEYKNSLLKYIIDEVGKSRAVHFDCGTDVKLFETLEIKEKMYLTGVSFTYSNEMIDNLEITEHNFKEVLCLDYLFTDFQSHPQSEMVKKTLNISYIPGLMKLKKHYAAIGNKQELEKCNVLIKKVLEDSGRKKEILSWYE